jgi:hypothetical protein
MKPIACVDANAGIELLSSRSRRCAIARAGRTRVSHCGNEGDIAAVREKATLGQPHVGLRAVLRGNRVEPKRAPTTVSVRNDCTRRTAARGARQAYDCTV